MAKALIITLYGDINYGNKFQNYALQTVLERYFDSVHTLSNSRMNRTKEKRILNSHIPKTFYNDTMYQIFRNKKIEEFSNKYLKCWSDGLAEKLPKEFDAICIGSDQIWNPYFYDNFFYSFAKFSNNVFSYAASIGIDEIPNVYKEEMKLGLSNVKNISVREDKAADIIEDLIGSRPEVHIDPTMLLTAKDWDRIIEKPKNMPKGKYIFTYFLGEYSKERRDYIKKIAKINNMEIVNLGQISDKKYYCASPSEFLYLIKNSSIVFTDSFHGSVFSIIYERPFYILNREDIGVKKMNSRMKTLYNKFELENREITDYEKTIEIICDYTRVKELLEVERQKAISYLDRIYKEYNNCSFGGKG